MNKPTTVSQLFPSKWLSAADLKGKTITLTITAVSIEQVRSSITNQDEWKAVLDFGRSKRFILNKTQCHQMTAITTSETFTDWKGQRITLTPDRARNGKPTIAIYATSDEQTTTTAVFTPQPNANGHTKESEIPY